MTKYNLKSVDFYFILTLKTKCSSTIFPSAQICSGHLSKLKILIVFAPNFFSLSFLQECQGSFYSFTVTTGTNTRTCASLSQKLSTLISVDQEVVHIKHTYTCIQTAPAVQINYLTMKRVGCTCLEQCASSSRQLLSRNSSQ